MNQIKKKNLIHINISKFFQKRGWIHKIDLCDFVWLRVSCMQHIIHIMHKGYIGHQSLEDQTLFGQNGCLTPSHSVTQPPNLVLLDRQTCALSFFYFWVECNQDKRPCIRLVDCNKDSEPCKIQFIKLVFIFIYLLIFGRL